MLRCPAALLPIQVDLEVLSINEGINVLDPPGPALAAILLGEVKACSDILGGEQRLFPQLAEVDVAIVQSPENAAARSLGLCCLLQVLDGNSALPIGLHDHVVQLLLEEVDLRHG